MQSFRTAIVPRARTRRHEGGAVAVEFALIFPVLAALLMGMLQYGWYFFTAQSASSAARETARRLVVGDCQTAGAAQTFARNQSKVGSLTLSYGTPAAPTTDVLPAVGDVLRVTVTADGKIIGFFPLPNGGTVNRIVDSRVEDTQAGAPCP